MLDLLEEIIRTPYFSGAAFFTGLLIGNWLTIGRDKRREFNEVAIVIREFLISARKHPSPTNRMPTDVQLDAFLIRLPFWKRRGFSKAWTRYKRTRKDGEVRDRIGGVDFKNRDELRECIDYLLRYAKPV